MKNYYIFTFLIILSGCGGGGGGQSSSTPAPQNNPPDIINTNFEYEVIENVSFAFDVLSTDPDGDPISYEINSGDDQSLFSISNVGSVSFINSPDFENPQDNDSNNIYELSIRDFDGKAYSQNYDFLVNVVNDTTDDDNNISPVCSVQSDSLEYCTLSWENLSREFYLAKPLDYSSENSIPLLISLHGGSDYATANMEYTGFLDIINEENFVAIFPQGTVAEGKGSTGWYAGGDCTNIEVCDLTFIEALIDYSIDNYGVDSKRVYVSGFSNGAFMVYTLACFLSNKVTAVAPVSGSLSPEDYNSCNPVRPMPILHIHGLNDSQIPVQGNDYITPVQQVYSFWRTENSCIQELVIDGADTNGDGYAWYSDIATECSEDVSINFTYLENFDHYWPISNPDKGGGSDINGPEYIWNFLKNYQINNVSE